jgi:deoxyadenosine/deoxycytidine kinase
LENLSLNPETLISDYCFTIEGNIGCGKSTFLEILKEKIPEAKWI